ncbi:hypothetical protein M5E87_14935 [Flavonifractor plautii]|nr:hypothetical protein M5E87_14935 [Flavonifractor plautii]
MGKKLLMLLGAFLVIYLLNFSIPRLMPGDPLTTPPGPPGTMWTPPTRRSRRSCCGPTTAWTSPFSTVGGYHCGQPPRGLRPEYPL